MSRSTGERVLVTGGGGFVASNLVARLLDDDDRREVVVLDRAELDRVTRETFDQFGERIELVRADVSDREAVENALGDVRCTHVVHAAAVTNFADGELTQPRRFVEVNVLGTLNLLDWSRGQRAVRRFVFV